MPSVLFKPILSGSAMLIATQEKFVLFFRMQKLAPQEIALGVVWLAVRQN